MKISQEVRDYAATHKIDAKKALEKGLQEKAEEFVEQGGEVYH